MKIVADFVFPDEPAWGLFEGPALVPQPDGSTEHRWVQDITVIRDDRPAHYVTDFGPASEFDSVTPLMVPSVGTDTVAELQELADRNRGDDYWMRRRIELLEGSTLIQDHILQIEQDQAAIKNRSSFGPAVRAQRGDVSRARGERSFNERRWAFHGKRVF